MVCKALCLNVPGGFGVAGIAEDFFVAQRETPFREVSDHRSIAPDASVPFKTKRLFLNTTSRASIQHFEDMYF